ncbi:MAG: two-component regulator propeller domain-containing protein [Candidatus Poribacteria bacterium]|nr:two-component regulator propeller domain-containing protein [Candidatus Poribacteria bacterium]
MVMRIRAQAKQNFPRFLVGTRATVCHGWSLLLLTVIFMVVGCAKLMPDPQSDLALEGALTDASSGKTQRVERTLISNEVNCIATDADNVWIATTAGVSRWHVKRGRWSHYTKENGLANDAVNAVAIDGQWVWFATDEGVSRYDLRTDAIKLSEVLMDWRAIKCHPLLWTVNMFGSALPTD